MTKLLLKVEDAASVLSVGRSKAYAMAASGELPSIRIGRRSVRVPVAALEAWINERAAAGQGDGSKEGTDDSTPRSQPSIASTPARAAGAWSPGSSRSNGTRASSPWGRVLAAEGAKRA